MIFIFIKNYYKYIIYNNQMKILYHFLMIFVTFTLIIKILFSLLVLIHYYLSKTKQDNKLNLKIDTKILLYKNKVEFLFHICIALLLIIIFNPFKAFEKYITQEMANLFFIFGIVTIITAEWNKFFLDES
jgi:hypothetical protein